MYEFNRRKKNNDCIDLITNRKVMKIKKHINLNKLHYFFKHTKKIEYFQFEEDFVEENVRCIPMIVRFKMDAVGIKLKLKEWAMMSLNEKKKLASINITTKKEKKKYYNYTKIIIKKYTGLDPTNLQIEDDPEWSNIEKIPEKFLTKASEFNLPINLNQWKNLSDLQRFALLKLCRPGHENKNFIKAIREFKLS